MCRVIQCASTVAVRIAIYVCIFVTKPPCYCERIAVQTLDVPRFVSWL